MKKIKLTQGKFALVDDADFEFLSLFKWYCNKGYACRHDSKDSVEYMHTLLTGWRMTDHIDMNKLNNCRVNLRKTDASSNQWNRGKKKTNTTGFKGVSYINKPHLKKRYTAQIMANRKNYFIGNFLTPEEAHEAYKKAAIELHGEFAKW